MPIPRRGRALRAVVACALATGIGSTQAQDIEPRAYSNAPVGVNFAIAGYAYTRGSLSFDPSVPVTDARLHTSSAVLAYATVLDLWGMSGKFDVIAPYTWLSGSALYKGDPIQRIVNGFGDPAFRLTVNLYGAPALNLREFASYEQDLIVGASLRVMPPVGQYDHTRIVNLGMNRWSFKPEVGVSKALGPWTLEATAAVTLFTDNDDFYNGGTRAQSAVYSFQGHAIYAFRSGIWASVDVTYFTGGRTTINGTLSDDRLRNWRAGATLALPVDVRNSIKLYASSGISARTGNSFDLLGAAWQYRWGGGL